MSPRRGVFDHVNGEGPLMEGTAVSLGRNCQDEGKGMDEKGSQILVYHIVAICPAVAL